MSRPVAVYGAGGHAKVVADALLLTGVDVIGFIDDDPALEGDRVLTLPVHGFAWLRERARDVDVAMGIGDNRVRALLVRRCREAGIGLAGVVHPAAVVAASASVGEGTVLMARAVINADAVVGPGVIVNTSAVVEHDVVVGEFAHLSPGAVLAGGSALGAFSSLGVGAVVLDDIAVGAGTIVGANAVVNRHLPDDVVAYGVPARVRRQLTPTGATE